VRVCSYVAKRDPKTDEDSYSTNKEMSRCLERCLTGDSGESVQ
jgi:hypothetical protein